MRWRKIHDSMCACACTSCAWKDTGFYYLRTFTTQLFVFLTSSKARCICMPVVPACCGLRTPAADIARSAKAVYSTAVWFGNGLVSLAKIQP